MIRGSRATAKSYAAVVVGLLQEEPEPIEWKDLHVGAKRGVNCEHRQAWGIIHKRNWEVAGGSEGGLDSQVLQIPDCVRGQLGHADCEGC